MAHLECIDCISDFPALRFSDLPIVLGRRERERERQSVGK